MKNLEVILQNGELMQYINIDRHYVENGVLYIEYTRNTLRKEGIPLSNIKCFKEV